jgi:Mn-dependent DtxR family transcriptional regulator
MLLTKWFTSIGVSAETAEEDACKIEHDLSAETFDKLKVYFTEN